jgi:hypothetical protein
MNAEFISLGGLESSLSEITWVIKSKSIDLKASPIRLSSQEMVVLFNLHQNLEVPAQHQLYRYAVAMNFWITYESFSQ